MVLEHWHKYSHNSHRGNCTANIPQSTHLALCLTPKGRIRAQAPRRPRYPFKGGLGHAHSACGGVLRICGDFKVGVIPVLHTDQYPLPRIEDIFVSLSGGQHFSKIDLAQTYLQMEQEESSKKYLTINTHKGLSNTTGLFLE